jgi:hypothetical protein
MGSLRAYRVPLLFIQRMTSVGATVLQKTEQVAKNYSRGALSL